MIPELNGKLTGIAFSVPTSNVSVIDLVARLNRSVDYRFSFFESIEKSNIQFQAEYEEICEAIKEASTDSMKGILAYSDNQIYSTALIGDIHPSIFDAKTSFSHR